MKKLLPTCLFLFYATTAFLQIYDLEGLPNNSDYPHEFMHIYTQEQAKQIVAYANSFDNQVAYKQETTKKIFDYMRSLLNDEQREMVLQRKAETVNTIIELRENNLNLKYSEEQKKSGLAYYVNLPDSLLFLPKMVKFVTYFETIQSAEQNEIIEAKNEADRMEWQQNLRAQYREGDANYQQRAEREQQKIPIYKELYVPNIEKLNQKLLKKLSPPDRQLLDSLRNFYYSTLDRLRQNKLSDCLSENGEIAAPNTHAFFSAQFNLVEIAPHLCLFWCPQYGYPFDDSSHMEFAQKLEYLTLKYKTALKPLRKAKEKHKMQVKEKIDAMKTPEERARDAARAKEPTLTIIASEEFAETNDVGDLWLFDANRKE